MTGLVDFVTQTELAKEIQRAVIKDSMPGQVSDQRILTLPEMTLTGYIRDKANDKIKVNTRKLFTKNYITKTEFTLEALEDLYRIYGEDLKEVLLHYIKFEQAQDIDNDFIAFCKGNAFPSNEMAFLAADRPDYEQIHMNIFTKLNRERVKLAVDTEVPVKTFSIVSPNIAASILSRIPSVPVERDGLSFVASMGNNEIFMDNSHVAAKDYVIVGAKGNGIKGSSTTFGTYQSLLYFAYDADSGQDKLFFSNRVGFEMNPLDTSTNETNTSKYLRKFEIDLTEFQEM